MDTLVILLPLVLGYLIRLHHRPTLKLIDRSLSWIVYLILGLMGIGLGAMDNLLAEIGDILSLTATLIGLTLVANMVALPLVDKLRPLFLENAKAKIPTFTLFLESLQLAGVVLAGVIVGVVFPAVGVHVDTLVNAVLMLLLLLIGMQLRSAGMTLRQILLNPHGIMIAAVVLATSLLAGAATAWIWELPTHQGLALAAGTGWYSLSGALISAELGPAMGSVAFLADLSRELIAIILIPILMQRTPASAIGYGGATALDFTLPVIQRSGGPQTVPIAIVSGFVLSVAGPILIPFFLAMG
ncbi:lysine exporter LysO family protein [Endozoicomonas ascidiicola]|uniref:lysine exporter LysO family protein n=1 Tax=Endozoicomonas ascidiicola TaxID=1698521 RepID=UPI000AB98F97|nr:lysine exporter LysO family protein [Endozoicomonas ascidiicola]